MVMVPYAMLKSSSKGWQTQNIPLLKHEALDVVVSSTSLFVR